MEYQIELLILIDWGGVVIAFGGDHVDGRFRPVKPVKRSILIVLYSIDLEGTKEKVIAVGDIIVKDVFEFPLG